MENDDIQEFYRLCEYYILHNIERSTGIPSNAKLQSTFRYLLIYINTNKNSKYILEEEKVKSYLADQAYDDNYINEIMERAEDHSRLNDLLDYVESYLVDEIEKDMYGHGDRCYTSLYHHLELVLRIKQQEYNYKFTNVHNLLVDGYYFDEKVADRFDQLAAFHTPEECPD